MAGRACVTRRVGGAGETRKVHRHGYGPDGSFGGVPEGTGLSPAFAVVAAVGLSGVFLVVFVPELWWVFTTYFWVVFPALGRLSRGVSGSSAGRRSAVGPERELLAALRRHGEITPGLAAAETSLSVAEADRMLGELAGDGHLEIRARGGAIFYALWEAKPASRAVASGKSES